MSAALLFDLPAMPALTKPPEPIVRAAEVEGCCRFTLSRRWSAGPLMACIGCNPSYADAKRDDPTMWRVMGFAYRWGFGGVTMLNVTPCITPDVAEMRAWIATDLPVVHIAIAENIKRVAAALRTASLHLAAWGNLVPEDDVAEFLFALAEERGHEPIDWHCFGVTNSGAPKHPMARGKHRIPDDAKPERWRFSASSA